MIGTTEMVLIVIVIMLLFGAQKIPELAKAIGSSYGEFKKAKHRVEKEVSEINGIELWRHELK